MLSFGGKRVKGSNADCHNFIYRKRVTMVVVVMMKIMMIMTLIMILVMARLKARAVKQFHPSSSSWGFFFIVVVALLSFYSYTFDADNYYQRS